MTTPTRFNLTLVDLTRVTLVEFRGAIEACERNIENFEAARVVRALPL